MGYLAYRNRSAASRWTSRIFHTALTLGFILFAIPIFVSPDHYGSLWPLVMLCGLWLALLCLRPAIFARSQFRNNPSAKGLTNLEVSGDGLRRRREHVESTAHWQGYSCWVEVKDVIALFCSPKAFVPILKRAFTTDDWNEFCDLLRRNLPGSLWAIRAASGWLYGGFYLGLVQHR